MSTDQAEQTAPADGKKQRPPRPKKFQKFAFATLKRSQLQVFECNPRSIDKHAYRKLRDTLKKTGLVEPIVVNLRSDGTHVILGGHQRTRCMDEIAGYPDEPGSDYDVPVALVQVSPAEEKQLVVSLNNPGLQGQWDYDLLEQLLADPDLDIFATGFDRADLGLMFDEGILDQLFGAEAVEQAAAEAGTVDALTEMSAAGKAADKTAAAKKAKQAAEVEKMKARRENYVEKSKDDNDAEFMIVLVGETSGQVDRFLAALELPVDQRYVSLASVAERIGIDIELPAGAASPQNQPEPAAAPVGNWLGDL